MNTNRHRKLLPYLAIAAILASNIATAQLDEIVVTATKRAESIQDVPISISAYSGDFLENSDIRTLQELSLYAPNFTMAYSSQATNARIAIRGIGSVGNSAIPGLDRSGESQVGQGVFMGTVDPGIGWQRRQLLQ